MVTSTVDSGNTHQLEMSDSNEIDNLKSPLKKQNTRSSPIKDSDIRSSVDSEMNEETKSSSAEDSQGLDQGDGSHTPKQGNNLAPQANQPPLQDAPKSQSFKAVNNRSANRRECRRIISAHGGDDHSQMTEKHNNRQYSRATVKFTLHADNDPIGNLKKYWQNSSVSCMNQTRRLHLYHGKRLISIMTPSLLPRRFQPHFQNYVNILKGCTYPNLVNLQCYMPV